jgi:hypothetical protein
MLYKVVLPEQLNTYDFDKEQLMTLLEYNGRHVMGREVGNDRIKIYSQRYETYPRHFFEEVSDNIEFYKTVMRQEVMELYENLSIALYQVMKEHNIKSIEIEGETYYIQDLENIFEHGNIAPYVKGEDVFEE